MCFYTRSTAISLPVIYTITLFLLPKTHVATRATAFARFIALCAHTFLLSTWAKLRIAFDPDSHNTNTTSPHTTKIQSYLPLILKYSNSASQLLRQVKKNFMKRHYIPQQIFHHLLIHQSQKFAKHFSSYKILMLNFYSLYLSPHCLSPFSLTVWLSVCLSVCLSLSLSLSLSLLLFLMVPYPFRTLIIMVLHNFLSLVVLCNLLFVISDGLYLLVSSALQPSCSALPGTLVFAVLLIFYLLSVQSK